MLPVSFLVERGVLAQFLSASAMQPSKDCDEVPKEDKSILSASLVPSIIRAYQIVGNDHEWFERHSLKDHAGQMLNVDLDLKTQRE